MFFAGLPKAVAHCKTKRGENALNLAVRAGMVLKNNFLAEIHLFLIFMQIGWRTVLVLRFQS